jgi:hypothetical protein
MSVLIAGGDFDNLDDAILQIQEEEKHIVYLPLYFSQHQASSQ